MSAPQNKLPTIKIPTTRKHASMINNKDSTRRQNLKHKQDTNATTERGLPMKRKNIGDKTTTTTSDTAIITDHQTEASSLPTSSPPLSTPSCPATPTPLGSSESMADRKRARKRIKKRNYKRNKKMRRANMELMKQGTTSTENTTTYATDKGALLNMTQESNNDDQQTENTKSVSASLSPKTATLTTIANLTSNEAENDVTPDTTVTIIDTSATAEDIDQVDRVDSNKDTQEKDTKDAMEALLRIEVEFARFRQKLFDERMEALQKEMVLIENGLHPDQLEMMKEIERKRNSRIKIATAKRDMSRLGHQMRFESTVRQAELTFAHKRKELRESIQQTLNEKRFKLNDEHSIISTKTSDLQLTISTQRQHRFNQIYDAKFTTGFPRPPPTQGISDQTATCDLIDIQGNLALEQPSTSNSHIDQSPQSPFILSTAPATPSSASSSFSSTSSSAITVPNHYQYKHTLTTNDFNLQPNQYAHKMKGIPIVDIQQNPTTIL